MAEVLRSSRSKMGTVVRTYRDTESGLFIARSSAGVFLAADADSEVAFLRGWSALLNVRPFSVVRNHFGRFRFVTTSFVPMDSEVVRITYPAWGRSLVKFRPCRYAPPVLAA